MASMRFAREKTVGCCIVVSPKLCPNVAIYSEGGSWGPCACEDHKARLRDPVRPTKPLPGYFRAHETRTCDFVPPDVMCEAPPARSFVNRADPVDIREICEGHADEFNTVIRPGMFEVPLPRGYGAKRLTTS